MTETFETKMTKGDTWAAQSEYSLGPCAGNFDGERGTRILKLRTAKHTRGGLWTSASIVIRVHHPDKGYFSETTTVFEDYFKTVLQTGPCRATEKAVRDTHAEALKSFPAIIEEATAFYAAKAQEAQRQAAAAETEATASL